MLRLLALVSILALVACSAPEDQASTATPQPTPTASNSASVPTAPPPATTAAPPATTTATVPGLPTQTTSPPPTSVPDVASQPPPTPDQVDPRPAGQEIDIPDLDLRYQLQVSQIDVTSGFVQASEQAIIDGFNGPVPDQLYFQVPAAGYGYFTLESLTLNGAPIEGQWLNDGATLAIALPDDPPLPLEIGFAFHLNVGGPEASGWGYLALDTDVLRLGYWFPQISNDHPFSTTLDPSFTRVSTFDVTLDLASGIDFAHSGEITNVEELPDGRKRYTFHAENIRDFDFAISPSYQRESITTPSGILVEYYWRADAVDVSDQVLATASATLERLGQLLVPYPWSTLRIADGGPALPGGIEYGNMIWINPAYPTLDGLLYHEIAHQWFYGTIGNRTLTDGWIDEGAAEFFERGLDSDFTDIPAVPDGGYCCALDSSLAELPTDRGYYYAIYEQGARLYYDVLSSMGWDDFWAAMGEIARQFKFQIVTPYDMLKTWQRKSTVDLRPLFDSYFRYPWISDLGPPGVSAQQGWIPIPPDG